MIYLSPLQVSRLKKRFHNEEGKILLKVSDPVPGLLLAMGNLHD